MLWADLLAEQWEGDTKVELQPHQTPPEHFEGWLMLGGRGAGKTFASMKYLSDSAHNRPGIRARIIAPTLDDAVNSCILDPDSGLLAHDRDAKLTAGLGGTRVVWSNCKDTDGVPSTCWVLGTPTLRDVDRLRALTNIELDIFEEAAANPMLTKAVEQARFSRRRQGARWVATTTPRPVPQIRAWLEDPKVNAVRASSFDNKHLPDQYRETLDSIKGTRLWRQEAMAEILMDAEGARWQYEWLDRSRVHDMPTEIDQYVVAVDPASGSGTTGIVAACRANGHIYVTDDVSVKDGTPEQWANAAVQLANLRNAVIIAEDNQGGRMVESTIKNTRTDLPVKMRRATMSKEQRADPVALLWEKEPPAAHIVGVLPSLEDQLCFPAGTMVATSRGEIPIESVTDADLVWTREGLAPLKWAGQTAVSNTLTSVIHEYGRVLCTPWHPIWNQTQQKFVNAQNVPDGDHLLVNPRWADSALQSRGEGTGTTAWNQMGTSGMQRESCCTGSSGKHTTEQSLKGSSLSTTSTMSRATTASRTWPFSLAKNTLLSILTRALAYPFQKHTRQRLNNGGQIGMVTSGVVTSAAKNSPHDKCEPWSARENVNSSVGAVENVRLTRSVPVFDLTVADGFLPEFYADGVLVHNCSWEPYPDGKKNRDSPDRLDAMVWACDWLKVPDKGVVTANPAHARIPSTTGMRGRSF